MRTLNDTNNLETQLKILNYLEQKKLEELKNYLATIEKVELIQLFVTLPLDKQVLVFRLLSKDKALEIFETFEPSVQQDLLRSFTDDGVIEFVNEMAPDDRVRLFYELPASVTKKLLAELSEEERATTNRLMGYEHETAGRIMTTEFISIKKEMTVEEALHKIRKLAKEMETIYILYVTDMAKKLKEYYH